MTSSFRPRRASLRSRILAEVSSLTVRPWIDYGRPRASVLRLLGAPADPRGVLRVPSEVSIERVRQAGVRGRWIRISDGPVSEAPGVLLYVHGGGFTFGSFQSHYSLVRRLQAETGLDVFFVEYRLAPEHRYPAAADDVLAAHAYLLDEGVDPTRIVLAGDSVGAQLVAGLMVDLVEYGVPRPAAVLMMSPMLDFTATQTRRLDRERRDPILSPRHGLRLARAYVGDEQLRDPRLAVLDVPKTGWPPTMITVGDTECLLGDASSMASSLRNAGVECELQVWPGQIHVFQGIGMLPEARASVRLAGRFLTEHLGVNVPSPRSTASVAPQA